MSSFHDVSSHTTLGDSTSRAHASLVKVMVCNDVLGDDGGAVPVMDVVVRGLAWPGKELSKIDGEKVLLLWGTCLLRVLLGLDGRVA